jgi:hypothetical protein
LVKKDVVARSAVQDAIGRLAPAGALVSHQIITIGAAEIGIRIVSTQTIDPIRVRQARDVLSRRTGRKVDISVDAVASKDELRAVLERIATPAPAPPQPAAPPTLSELRDRTVAIVGPRVKELWPAEELPILGYEVAYGDAGCTVRVGVSGAPGDRAGGGGCSATGVVGRVADAGSDCRTAQAIPSRASQIAERISCICGMADASHRPQKFGQPNERLVEEKWPPNPQSRRLPTFACEFWNAFSAEICRRVRDVQ